jgi:ABC-2 type transport system permease protein
VSAFAGTGRLVRLALRLDRVWLTVWVLVISLSPLATAAQYKELYPTTASIEAVRSVFSNVSLIALNGPLYRVSVGGMTAWKILVTLVILVGLMSILTVVRHSRAEEENGRLELLGSTVVGRYAPLTAALLTAWLANAAIVVLTAVLLLTTGLGTAGAFALGLAVGLAGVVFSAVAAVTAQLAASARGAVGLAVAVLGAAYLLRAAGDTGGAAQPHWLTWVSPIGWALELRAYAGERWWVLAPAAGLTLVLLAVAYDVVAHRDLGAGVLAQRPGRARASAGLRGPFALAWRLQRGNLLGWAVGLAAAGAVMGSAANSLTGQLTSNRQLTEVLARLGGEKGVTDQFLAAVYGIIGLTAAAYTVQTVNRLREEESTGRVEPLLVTGVSRFRWAASHLTIALLGTAALLVVAGVAGGLVHGAATGDVGGETWRLVGAALVQVPAAWVFAGLGIALFGLAPKLTGLNWAALVGCVVLLELGALLNLDRAVVDASPFAHVPKLPGSQLMALPLVSLLAIALVLGGIGLLSWRRRDVAPG